MVSKREISPSLRFDAARPIVAATCFHQRAGGAMGLARVRLPDWRISRPHMWRPSAVEGKLMGLRKMTTGNPQTAGREGLFTEKVPERRDFSSLGCLGEGG